jgi:hypothetical protein
MTLKFLKDYLIAALNYERGKGDWDRMMSIEHRVAFIQKYEALLAWR